QTFSLDCECAHFSPTCLLSASLNGSWQPLSEKACLVISNKNLTLSLMVGRADNTLFLHQFDEARRAVIADLQAALDVACRGTLVAGDNGDGLVIEVIARAGTIKREGVFALFFLGGDGFEIFRHTLLFQKGHDFFDFLVGNEGAVHAADAATASHVEHVALAEKLLGALFAENGAAVDLRGDLKGNAGREVRLDGAGDDVHARALCCGD